MVPNIHRYTVEIRSVWQMNHCKSRVFIFSEVKFTMHIYSNGVIILRRASPGNQVSWPA